MAEVYAPEIGWALRDGREHGYDPAWDAVEADALYSLFEREVIPEFYTCDESGIPTAVDQAGARKHGAIDASLLGKPRGKQRRGGQASSRLSACGGSEMEFGALRRLAGRNQRGPPRV